MFLFFLQLNLWCACGGDFNLHSNDHALQHNPFRFYPKEEHYPSSLDDLPSVVVDKIFEFCSHKDLMAISRAFP